MTSDQEIQINVARTGRVFDPFFDVFGGGDAAKTIAAVRGLRVATSHLSAPADLRLNGLFGWSYWCLYIDGYLRYATAKTVSGRSPYLLYLRGPFREQGHDPGLEPVLARADSAIERVRLRFEDFDAFLADATAPPIDPVRVVTTRRPPPQPRLVYVHEEEAPILARFIDGYHRIFLARLCGRPALPALLREEATDLDKLEGRVEVRVRGEEVYVEGWVRSSAAPVDTVELRHGASTIRLIPTASARAAKADSATSGRRTLSAVSTYPLPAGRSHLFELVGWSEFRAVGRLYVASSVGGDT
jgi:hypothetical protein